ncbi:hypothetical protein V8E51_011012 [Hyaloscypha variabilis]
MPRAAHRKSRHGCANCKQRRVKCDEKKPSCDRCISREIACKYLPATTIIWTTSTPSQDETQNSSSNGTSSTSKSTASISTQAKDADPTPLNLEGIALIIHWFTTTVHTVVATSGPNARALEVCQTLIISQAMQHAFLLHGLLALSALHLADTQSLPPERERYTRLATRHHSQGLTLYRGVLDDVNEANYAASIAFSSLTAMFAVGLYRPREGAGEEVIDDLCRIFLLVKGWGVVVGVADGLDCTDGLVLGCGRIEGEDLDVETRRAFNRLHELNRRRSEEGDVELYTLAIESLRSVFNEMKCVEKRSDPHLAMMWMDLLPGKCIRLFEERQGLALLLLAYYRVVLERVPKVWWLRGWSTGLLKAVRENIGEEYRVELKWVEDSIA